MYQFFASGLIFSASFQVLTSASPILNYDNGFAYINCLMVPALDFLKDSLKRLQK